MSMAAVLFIASSCVNVTKTEVHVLPDSPAPRVMMPALFTNVPDGLIDELGVKDGIPSSLCSFLVRKDGKEILIDSGNGVADSQLVPLLEVHGVKPEDIDGSGLQGLKAQQVIHAAIESLKTGRVIYLEEMFPSK